jgi:hypothetical protein
MHSSACRADERYFLYDQDRIEVIFRRHVRSLRTGKSRSMPNYGYRHPAANGVLARVVPVQHFAENSHRSWQPSSGVARFTRADVIPIHVFVRWSSKRTCGDGARRGPTRGNLDPYVESGKPNNECLLEKIGTCGTRRPCCRRSICLHIDHDPQTRMKQNLGSMIER